MESIVVMAAQMEHVHHQQTAPTRLLSQARGAGPQACDNNCVGAEGLGMHVVVPVVESQNYGMTRI